MKINKKILISMMFMSVMNNGMAKSADNLSIDNVTDGEEKSVLSKEDHNKLNIDLINIGKKYNLSKDTVNDLLIEATNTDSETMTNSDGDIVLEKNTDMAKSETKFIEKSRLQSIPLKDIEQLRMINDDHKDPIPFYIMTVKIDAYRLSGDRENVGKQIALLKNTKTVEEFNNNLLLFDNVETIIHKKKFPVTLNSKGYATAPSSFEMINSKSFFNEEKKNLDNKPYGYAFYINSPKNSTIKTLLGVYDNPCDFADHDTPICYQNSTIDDISDKKYGVTSSEYNDLSKTQIVVKYQTTQKIIP